MATASLKTSKEPNQEPNIYIYICIYKITIKKTTTKFWKKTHIEIYNTYKLITILKRSFYNLLLHEQEFQRATLTQ